MVGGVGRTSGGAVATLRTTFDRTPPDTLGTTKGFVRLVTLLTAVRVSLETAMSTGVVTIRFTQHNGCALDHTFICGPLGGQLG